MEKLYTTDEVAEMLHVTRRTLYNYIAQGRIKGVKLGRDWRFKPEQVQAFYDSLTENSKSVEHNKD